VKIFKKKHILAEKDTLSKVNDVSFILKSIFVNRATMYTNNSKSQISDFLVPPEESFHAKATISKIEQITKIVAK